MSLETLGDTYMQNKRKVLVVEDNDFIRMQILKFLQDEDYETIESTDGEHALSVMEKDIDMAIVDVRMEPMNGFEFIKTLRGRENKTPVILVTGDQNPDLLTEAQKWGVSAVLMKPVQRDRLLQTVSRTIRIHDRA